MVETDDEFSDLTLRLPSDLLRQLNLPPHTARRLSPLVSPEATRKFQQFAQLQQALQQAGQNPLLKLLNPRMREMIASVLKKRRDKAAIEEELRRLESWLDSEGFDRKWWDPEAATPAREAKSPAPAPAQEAEPPQAPSPEQSSRITAKAWVADAVKRWRPQEGEEDYAARLQTHAPKAWKKKTIQNALSGLLRKA
jgi:hypothetical protein